MMKTLSRFFIAFILATITYLPAMAEGYTALVLPNSSVMPKKINRVDNTDIEKLLARKIINKMERSGTDYAPTLDVLRISIINNTDYKKNPKEAMDNVRAISKAYGISKVIVVSSDTELLSVNDQKEFWRKMDLPVLIQPEPNIKVTTTIILYDSKNDQIVYSDVFYKKLNLSSSDMSNESRKLDALNTYYDELLPRLFDGLKESKETHAKIISNADDIKTATPVMMYKPVAKSENKVSENSVTRKIKPDLTVKENVSDMKKESFFAKLKESFKLKYANETRPSEKKVTSSATKLKPYVVKKSTVKKIAKENGFNKKTEPKKTKSVSLGSSIRTKYSDVKSKYITKKINQTEKNEENVKYSMTVMPTEENTSSANKYIQTRPRANAKGYIPHFENEVNDI